MFELLMNHLSTIAVGAFVAALTVLAARKLIRDKKKGKSSCSCGCANCPSAGICHTK